MQVATLETSGLVVEPEDGYMWLLGAVEHRETPDCYEGDSTNHPEERDDCILWLEPGLTTAEDDCRLPRSWGLPLSSCGVDKASCPEHCFPR